MKLAKQFLIGLVCLHFFPTQAQDANLVIPMGHAQQINCVVTSHDYSLIASSDDSNIIHLWDTQSRREVMQLSDHPRGIVNIAFNPAKKELASSDILGNIFIWNALTGELIHKIKTEEENPWVTYNGVGDKLVVGGKSLKQYDVTNGKLTKTLEVSEEISRLTFSKVHDALLAGTPSGTILMYKESDLTESFKHQHHNQPIHAITSYDQGSTHIIVGYTDGFISVINPETKKAQYHTRVLERAVHNIVANASTKGLIAMGRDSDEDLIFLTSDLKEDKSMKFKWSSKPVDEHGLIGASWAGDNYDSVYLADHGGTIRLWSTKRKKLSRDVFKGTARPIYDIDINGKGESLVIGSRHGQLKVLDLTGGHQIQLLRGVGWNNLIQLDYHEERPLIIGAGKDEQINIWNSETGEKLETLKRMNYLDFNVQFTVNNNFFKKIEPDEYEMYDFKRKSEKKLKLGGAKQMKISSDGVNIVFQMENELKFYTSYDLEYASSIPTPGIVDFTFTLDQVMVLAGSTVTTYLDGVKRNEVRVSKVANRIKALENGEFILFHSDDSYSADFHAYHYSKEGKLISELIGHHHYISTILEVQDRVLTASLDGSIKIWNKIDGKLQEIGSVIPLRLEDYVVITPDDLFDATPYAMQQMHFTIKGEIVALEQLKDTYYEPNLLPKLLGYGNTELRKPQDINELGISPKVEVTQHPNKGNGILKFKVTNKGGGIGRVELVINGKEVASDLRIDKNTELEISELEYDIKGHPFLYDNKPSKIGIKSYNRDGTIGSETKNIYVLPSNTTKATGQPKIYALIIGTSDYAEDEMDLKYAAKDAQDFASALRISSSNLIGGDNLRMTVLTTDKGDDYQPTKDNIIAAFKQYAKEAKARDYLIVYMAGHGVNSGGEHGDFYYLTSTAKDGRVFDEETREKHAISSYEFTEYIKSVPALNQVMIVDACHSGTLTSAFGKGQPSKSMSSEEVKAYERMKDRTGIFLLAGSAADAVSYETTLYGQGLLTYALLFGMKGAALHEGEYIDVLDLFQFAAKKVPQLAEDIGGIQRPEVRVPTEAESFNIGKMNDHDKASIKLLQPKPVFVHTSFQHTDRFSDVLRLGKALDSKLGKLAKTDGAPIIFMNENHFSGALQVRGRYEEKGPLTIVSVKVFEDDKLVEEFKVEGVNVNSISGKVFSRLMRMVESS